VYERELVNAVTLRERVGTMGWDEAWVERVIETQKGKMTADLGLMSASAKLRMGNGYSSGLGTSRLYEIVHAYRRLCDEEGVPEVRYTCFSPGLLAALPGRGTNPKLKKRGNGALGTSRPTYSDSMDPELKGIVGYDGALDYAGVTLPFVLWEREKIGRLVDEARGYGSVALTMQQQIKVEWDSGVDRSSLATLPPRYHRPGHEPERWGPGVALPLVRRDDVGYVDAPKYDPGSKESEMTARRFADEYFGRAVDESNVVEGQALKQELADTWMEACGEIDSRILKLCQQLLPDEIMFRVVGAAKGRSMKASKEEIQGSFDVMVGYNTENMDSAVKVAKIELMEKALGMDVNGILDRDAVMETVFELIDPNLGERLLRPGEEARQAEIEDEDGVFAKMSSGVPVDIKPGQAYQVRLERLQQILQGSPPAQKRYMQDEAFRKIVDWRMQQLGHQLEQRENAQIGRLGGKKGFDQFES
jgi:hypothetical protein